jgi:2-dehydro-3-deoxygluconokinase
MGPEDLAPAHFEGARLLHITGITPALSPSCVAAVERAIALARAANALISVDPNIRLQLFPDAETCRRILLPLLAAADLVLLGDEDAAVLFPDLAEAAVPEAVQALGPRTVVLKLGARGACAVREQRTARVPIYPVSVVDTVGAGDGFDAGFIAGLLHGRSLEHCLRLGARIGAAAVAVAGDWEGYPSRHELELEWRGALGDE